MNFLPFKFKSIYSSFLREALIRSGDARDYLFIERIKLTEYLDANFIDPNENEPGRSLAAGIYFELDGSATARGIIQYTGPQLVGLAQIGVVTIPASIVQQKMRVLSTNIFHTACPILNAASNTFDNWNAQVDLTASSGIGVITINAPTSGPNLESNSLIYMNAKIYPSPGGIQTI